MENRAVVLAFSGGLDTSFCIPYLKNERGLEVHTITVNSGGFSANEEKELENRALALGATSHRTVNVVEEFYQKGIKYLLFGNILKNGTYPLSVSSERVFQALKVLEFVKEIDAPYVAHGSTGAGNDQIRFDIIFEIMSPQTKIIAPIRELSLSRKEEIEYLKKCGVELSWESAKYSINKGIWGTSVGGAETLNSWGVLPQEAFPSQVVESGSRRVKIQFTQGEPTALDGVEDTPLKIIEQLNEIGSKYGVGRGMHTGDTIIGMKGRLGFEAPAATVLIKAHHLLEKHVLTKKQLYWKEQLANQYGELMHEAQYLEPVMRDIEGFLQDTQRNVTGWVEVELSPYRFEVLASSSPYDLMNSKFGEYGETNSSLTGQDVAGFTKVLANPLKIYYAINKND
ncbi:MAG: argininosuccinate synthase [Bacteroidales bacterium]